MASPARRLDEASALALSLLVIGLGLGAPALDLAWPIGLAWELDMALARALVGLAISWGLGFRLSLSLA